MQDKCACPCLIATGELEHALYEITELDFQECGDNCWRAVDEKGEETQIPADLIEEAHAALTKAEKACGYRAEGIRETIRHIAKENELEADSPDAWRDAMVALFLQEMRTKCEIEKETEAGGVGPQPFFMTKMERVIEHRRDRIAKEKAASK